MPPRSQRSQTRLRTQPLFALLGAAATVAAALTAHAQTPAAPPAPPATPPTAAPPAPPVAPAAPASPDAPEPPAAVRELTLRRFGDPALIGPGRVDVLRLGPAAEQRSAIGVWLGAADADGLRVERVTADGPAAKAGLAAGDRLVAVNGTALRVDQADLGDPLLAQVPARRLERAVGRLAPGSEVELRYQRDGRDRTVKLRTVAPSALADAGTPRAGTFFFGERAPLRVPMPPREMERLRAPLADSAGADYGRRLRRWSDSARAAAARRPALGVSVSGTGAARDTLGLFVDRVVAGGPAERAGVKEGDRIAAIDDVALRVPRDERDDPRAAGARSARFTRQIEGAKPGDRVTLRLWSDGRWRTVTATLAPAGDVYKGGPGAIGFGAFGPNGFAPGAVWFEAFDRLPRPMLRRGTRSAPRAPHIEVRVRRSPAS